MGHLYRLLGISHRRGAAWHPETQGIVERANSTLKSLLRCCLVGEDERKWDDYLPLIAFATRSTVSAATGYTPFQLIFGHEVRTPLTIFKEWVTEDKVDEGSMNVKRDISFDSYVAQLRRVMSKLARRAIRHEEEVKLKRKERYDAKANVTEYKKGDMVYILLPARKHTLLPMWKGPYVIESVIPPVDYVVVVPNSKKTRRVVHTNMCRPFIPRLAMYSTRVNETDEIITESFPPALSECMDHTNIEYPVNLTQDQLSALKKLIIKHKRIFSDIPGLTDLVEFDIRTIDDEPVFCAPYPIPQALEAQARQEIDQALSLGLIALVRGTVNATSYAAPSIVVRKKESDSYRVVIDYRRLNARSLPNHYALPHLGQLIDIVSVAKYLSVLDLTRGYNQIKCSSSTVPKTGFTCLGKHYVSLRMPFGSSGSSAIAQTLIDLVCRGHEEYARGFVDDVCIFSNTWADHLNHLDAICAALSAAGLTVRPKKVQLAQRTLNFLGHIVGSGTKKPQPDKLLLVDSIAKPLVKRSLRAFLGTVGFYRHFIPNFAAIAAPMTDMLVKTHPTLLRWTPKGLAAFEALKQALITTPVLKAPDFTRPFTLMTDASEHHIAACLCQRDDSTILHPIIYVSKKLNPTEAKYASIEREMYAIFMGVQKLKYYLLGRCFEIFTDCLPLLSSHKSTENKRILNWSLRLADYQYTLSHVPGKQNILPDYLSRYLDAQTDGVDDPPVRVSECLC
jgi:hypothetical protein